MKIKKVVLFSLLTIAIMFQSCSDDKNNNESKGTLSIKITDAPFPYEMISEANITISKVEARKKDTTQESPFIVLSEQEASLNLIELSNGITETLVSIQVAAGDYDLIRLYIKDASVKLMDGRDFDLTVPSGAQTGIKIFLKPDIKVIGGVSTDLLLDVDVSKSFIPKGNINSINGINGFNFKPVIKASNLSTTGTLVGMVNDTISNPIKGAQIAVYVADILNTTSFTDSLGNYTILGLLKGNYKVEAEKDGYISEEAMVEIADGNNTTQDFILTPEAQ